MVGLKYRYWLVFCLWTKDKVQENQMEASQVALYSNWHGGSAAFKKTT